MASFGHNEDRRHATCFQRKLNPKTSANSAECSAVGSTVLQSHIEAVMPSLKLARRPIRPIKGAFYVICLELLSNQVNLLVRSTMTNVQITCIIEERDYSFFILGLILAPILELGPSGGVFVLGKNSTC